MGADNEFFEPRARIKPYDFILCPLKGLFYVHDAANAYCDEPVYRV
jgi:hypothetical protein